MSVSYPGEKITFYAHGTPISGMMWLPEDRREGQKHPAIVYCMGFVGVKEFMIPEFARFFNQEGYVILGFDYAGLGESGGDPGRLIPLDQVEEIRCAITYLETRDEVYTDKIGLYGGSMGGAHGPYVAAHDRRVKCVVARQPVADNDRWFLGMWGYVYYFEMKKRLDEDRRRRVLTGKSERVPQTVYIQRDPSGAADRERVHKQWPSMGVEISLEVIDKYLEYRPEAFVDRVSPTPLFIVAHDQPIVPVMESISMYEKAKEPKKLWIVPPSIIEAERNPEFGHYSVYETKPILEGISKFFKEWLPP